MTYILLAAGKGSRLNPLTKKLPKCLYRLETNVTILQMMINNIRSCDNNANIVVVTGFMKNMLEESIEGAIFVNNPFYSFTNSIASLWFAKEFLCGHITIINADVVVEKELINNIISKELDYPLVLLDSSIKSDGDYNVQIKNDYVVVMSKELKIYYGEYAGITKLDPASTNILLCEIDDMIQNEAYDQWYENALVQLIFNYDFKLYFYDISNYKWTEVDSVNDLLKAKDIHFSNKESKC